MGSPAWKTPTTTNAHPHFAASAAFPSPASVNSSLDSPPHEHALASPLSTRVISRHGLVELAYAVPTEPDGISFESIITPPTEDEAESTSFNTIVGGALAPVQTASAPRPTPRSRRGMHLPSFETLGIAAPHPDRVGVVGFDSTSANVASEFMDGAWSVPHADSNGTTHLGSTEQIASLNPPSEKAASRVVQSLAHQYGDPLTPPAEVGDIDWKASTGTAALSPSTESETVISVARETYSDAPSAAMTGLASQAEGSGSEGDDQAPWYAGAVGTIGSAPPNSVKILSHALPTPSSTGHIFSTVINAVQDSTPVTPMSPMTWINVFHAIPGRFNLADIPRSPPSTPGPAIGGDDYFSQKIFDSAVSIADYQEDPSQLPRSPCSVVPPGSIDLSIVERYIPPSNSNEFAHMFDSHGRSILVDRIVELSPNNGSLLFIYPTKAGGQTFTREYLGPILDPILRSMGVVYGISTALSRALGSMASADHLPNHEVLQRRIASLCARITAGSAPFDRFPSRRPILKLSYASKEYVHLDRKAWAQDWWAKQEKPRLREALTRHARESHHRSNNDYGDRPRTSTELLQELLSGVEEKQLYPSGQEPEHGVEVSVFVITRTG
ncbi:hypothetical protein LTR37_013590 [Vermiconidia calcicola]|uniref:Uncharacterized protein n=1 Tax=Vermiconidia calcicola TaxID=1690605 RepID=A0ACC3MXP9_9PEZI|nr:hypothetical protein LTR37_013590 [Vermiconidia calcicola]